MSQDFNPMAEDSITDPAPQVKSAGLSSAARRRVIVSLGGLAILALAFGVVWLQSAKYEPLVVGMTAPDFRLPDLQGKTQRLSDYRGKVVFLNFWATWCKPCKEQMDSMQRLWRDHRPQGFTILAVPTDLEGPPEDGRPSCEARR